MKKEIRLVKTCVGLVSDYSIMCLAHRATEIALETDITYDEALNVLLKLASVEIENWYEDEYIFSKVIETIRKIFNERLSLLNDINANL